MPRIFQEAVIHFGAGLMLEDEGAFPAILINLSVPKSFVTQLVGRYSGGFATSLQACQSLLAETLFTPESEQFELTIPIGGRLPLQYEFSRSGQVPSEEELAKLGAALQRFVQSFASGPMRPTEQREEEGLIWASTAYRRVVTTEDTRLDSV